MSTKVETGQSYRLRDRRPETRDAGGEWRPWHPDPMISPLSPALQFVAQRMTCRHCAEKIPYATVVAAVQRGKWAEYCSPRHRDVAAHRRFRVKRSQT